MRATAILRLLKTLAGEARRRKVLRAVTAYAVAAWLVLQAAEVTFEPLGLPEWAMRATIVAAVVGLPIVFAIAWIIAVEPDGVRLDLPLWRGDQDREARAPRAADAIALGLVAGLLVLWGWSVSTFLPASRQAVASSPPDSIAVLAFDNFAGLQETDHFAAGLSAEIINLLAGVEGLQVASRTSSFRFRGTQVDVREVAELLQVKHVLEGSVRQVGKRIRVNAQLTDGANGYQAWSQTYDRELNDIFRIQEEIATAVVGELRVALSVEAQAQLRQRPTDRVDAYLYYLQARDQLTRSPSAAALRRAVTLFNQSLAIDEQFAAAHAGVCEAQLGLYVISAAVTDFTSAEQACTRARGLQPQATPDVELAFAKLYRQRGWHDRALASVDQVLALDPSNVEALVERGEVLAARGERDRARASFEQAIAARPSDWRGHEALASELYRAQRYGEAAQTYEYVNRLAPDVASGFAGKGAAYWMLGELPKAQAAFEQSLTLAPTRQGFTNTGIYYYYAGNFERAAQMQRKAIDYAPDDHVLWGRLGDAQRFVPAQQEQARSSIERAVALAQGNLQVNPQDWWTVSLLGLYRARLGEVREGLRLIEQAVSQLPGDAEALYYLALARLAAQDRAGALDAIERAVRANESYRIFVGQDPDLQALAGEERYAELMKLAAAPSPASTSP